MEGLKNNMLPITLRREIFKYYKKNFKKARFIPKKSYIPVSGKIFDTSELLFGVESILDGWWTEGRFGKLFEKAFGNYLNVRYVSLVNSGSSANLLAFSALTVESLGSRRIAPGDEVITAATGFPTTVNPILQYGCVPVFVDNDLYTKNTSVESIEKAISPKTKAIMMAHTLGNPFSLKKVVELAKKYNLWLIEDCCDALGSRYAGRLVGTFGDISTFSFYPAHQITMGEGGAVITNNPLLHRAIRQFRDWGRDCWCDTGKDNTCRKRFSWKMGDLPSGYDHKYIYSQNGYNLKLTDMQAAIGLAQLKKLPKFIKIRTANFEKLYNIFRPYSRYFILSEKLPEAETCWFGFMLVISANAPFTRLDIVSFFEERGIATRSLFAGNLTKHPAFQRRTIRIEGKLNNSNIIMNNGFWIGVYPGISNQHIAYIKSILTEFLNPYLDHNQ